MLLRMFIVFMYCTSFTIVTRLEYFSIKAGECGIHLAKFIDLMLQWNLYNIDTFKSLIFQISLCTKGTGVLIFKCPINRFLA